MHWRRTLEEQNGIEGEVKSRRGKEEKGVYLPRQTGHCAPPAHRSFIFNGQKYKFTVSFRAEFGPPGAYIFPLDNQGLISYSAPSKI